MKQKGPQHGSTPETRPSKRRKMAVTMPEPTTPPQVDNTTFPFLKLPGEIRNMIYKYCLVDAEYSIRLIPYVSKKDGRCIVRRLYRARPGPPDRDDLPTSPRKCLSKASTSFTRTQRFWQFNFVVNIFQTCQQINAEAAPLFYGMNVFAFDSVPHLYTFLNHFTHRLPLVRKLGTASIQSYCCDWSLGGCEISQLISHLTLDHVFPLLTHATNLEVLYINASIYQSLSSKANLAAKKFYEKAHLWLWAMILDKRNPLEILRLPNLKVKKDVNGQQWVNKQWSTSKNGQDEFLAELTARLIVPVPKLL